MITAMIQAYSEQLITIDELRARMPDLRAREQNPRAQLGALDARAADRDAYLKLAGDWRASSPSCAAAPPLPAPTTAGGCCC